MISVAAAFGFKRSYPLRRLLFGVFSSCSIEIETSAMAARSAP